MRCPYHYTLLGERWEVKGGKNGILAWCQLDSNTDKALHPVREIQKWGVQTEWRELGVAWGLGG